MSGSYSFADTLCAIQGPGLQLNLSDSGVADEGIEWRFINNKNEMVGGAAGDAMHNLMKSKRGEMIIRLLKTSPYNAVLSQAYHLQEATTALWGLNVISVVNIALQDNISGVQCAFRKFPDLRYATTGGSNEWVFDVAILTPTLGGGTLGAVAGLIGTLAL